MSEIRPSAIGPGGVLRQRYRLDSEIGRGGMGIVYRATDLELMREVAVKVLPETSSSAEARQRLIREARAAAALNHPHIVSVHDVGEADGIPFFVMELVPGPSLSRQRPVELPRIIDIASQICAALEHAHSNSIVHRDLKPENILLSSSGTTSRIKLADLGLALPSDAARISRAGMIVGTAAYMAPEQALGQTVDGRTDLYALGVLLYELTTGRVPFKGDDPLAVVSQHIHASAVPPRVLRPDLPRAVENVILRLLAKDPAQRYATAAETDAALRAAMAAAETEVDEGAADAVAILDALSRGHLIGRAAELTEARELWRRARDGHGHAVLLSGEPGAGKTRLAREITVQAALDGAVVLTGGCYEYEATTPYLPFVEAVRKWAREETDDATLCRLLGDSAAQIAKLAPEIERRLGSCPDCAELAPQEERLLFFDAVAKVFANLAREKGLLFYADDLHWADRGTLWLLSHLLRHLRTERVLILGAYRETELDRAHPLSKALVDWNRERLVTRITLRRFDAEETSAQLGALLGENVSAEFGEAVHRETEGNPFFVEEVLKALIEKGSVRRESGHWKRCDVDQLVIPQSVKEAIGTRLDRVSKDANEVLRAAAVLGKTFSFEDLAVTASDQKEDALLDALDEAVGAQLITADRNESFVFTHDKIREVLYEELNPIRRRRLHRHAAEALERRRSTSHCAVERLAHHYIKAGDYERGLVFAKQAAAAAEHVFAFDDAIAAYSQALDCAQALELTEEQLALEEAIGKAYLLHGDLIPAGEHFINASALAADPVVRARLQCEAASSLVATGDQRGLEYLHEGLKVFDPDKHPLETAQALSIEGRFHHLAGRHKEAIELLERAADLVAPVAAGETVTTFAASTISHIYSYAAGAYQHWGLFDDGDVWARRAIEFGKAHKILFAQAIGLEFLGENAVHKGEHENGLSYATQEFELADKLHSRERRTWAHLVAGQNYKALGLCEEAEQEFSDGIRLAEAIGELRVMSLMKGFLATLLADKATGNLAVARTNAASLPFHRHQEQRHTSPGSQARTTNSRSASSSRHSGQSLNTAALSQDELLNKALSMATENYELSESVGLLYTRFESRRCLGHVHWRRGALDKAEAFCADALKVVSDTASRVSRLWLGPLYIDVLIEMSKQATARGEADLAAAKRAEAADHLARYTKLVNVCQSPRFANEAERLATVIDQT